MSDEKPAKKTRTAAPKSTRRKSHTLDFLGVDLRNNMAARCAPELSRMISEATGRDQKVLARMIDTQVQRGVVVACAEWLDKNGSA